MLLSAAFAALCVVVLVALLAPLLGRVGADDGSAADVFAAQLRELDGEVQRGMISPADAAAARAEIARRLLRADRAKGAAAALRPRRLAALAVVVFVPAVAVGGYELLGAPGFADQPLSARRGPDAATLARLAGEAEQRVAADPKDGEAWIELASLEMRRSRFTEAAAAFARASGVAGERAELKLGEAQALVLAGGGKISPAADAAFDRAVALARDEEQRSVIGAIAARARGNLEEAARLWSGLLRASDGTEPWLEVARAEVMRIAAVSGRVPPAGPREPLADPEQQAMIEGMVERLSERLRTSGGSAEEWARLVRSYRVLGREDDARATAQEALRKLPEPDRPSFAAADGIVDLVR